MKTSKLFLPLIVFAALFAVAACGRDDARTSDRNVRFGVLFPMTGDLADKGKDSTRGVTLAVEEVNAAGGISALGGAKLEMASGDTCGNPDIGMKETERLINEQGVAAIVGTYQSSVTKAATQVAEKHETPFIVSISIADVITERGFRYTFRVQPKAQFYGRDQARFLADLKEMTGYRVKRVALLHENTDFGTTSSLAQKKALREQGMEVVADVSYAAEGVTDLTGEVSRVLAARPHAILAVTYLNDSILIRRAMAKSGTRVPLVDTAGGTVSPEYVQQLGEMADGTLTSSEYSKYAVGGKELNDRYRRRFGVDITGDSAYAYQSVMVLKDALERAASKDRKKLRDALAATDMPRGPSMILPSRRLKFDAQGQNIHARLFIVQIQKGELVPVWPAEYATAKILSIK